MWCASQEDDLESAMVISCLPHTLILAETKRTLTTIPRCFVNRFLLSTKLEHLR